MRGWAGLLALLGALSCGTSRGSESRSAEGALPGAEGAPAAGAARRGGPAVVRGTTLAASTGRPLAGVLVQGPGGTQATSDRDGRFELSGLPAGMEGELFATSGDGRAGRNVLRELRPGVLEVVVFLR